MHFIAVVYLVLFVGLFLAGWWETLQLIVVVGKMRRGFCFRQVPLSEAERVFLQALKRDPANIDQRYLRFPHVVWAERRNFILKRNNEIYIQYRRRGYRTSLPFVGYVNLNEPAPRLQFRGSLSMHLLFPVCMVLIVCIDPTLVGVILIVLLVVLAVFVGNHWIVTTGIHAYIRDLAAARAR